MEKEKRLMEILTCVDAPGNYRKLGFVDTWSQRFNIYLDLNYDNKVKIGGKEETGTVFVYSSGPNRNDETGRVDDICSWKE
ncbi:MAG: hypothetical protein WAX69_21680 [Victivallales bacterium]